MTGLGKRSAFWQDLLANPASSQCLVVAPELSQYSLVMLVLQQDLALLLAVAVSKNLRPRAMGMQVAWWRSDLLTVPTLAFEV